MDIRYAFWNNKGRHQQQGRLAFQAIAGYAEAHRTVESWR